MPWDIPPIPTRGDLDAETIFAAVGGALSQWEFFEGHLGEIYSFLIGSSAQTSPTMRAYGSVSSFSTRIDLVKAAASAYFMRKSNPLNDDLRSLFDKAKSFSFRRNDIAHGIVQPVSLGSGLSPNTLALVPSRHATRRRRLEYNLDTSRFDAKYDYAYTSKEIATFSGCFTNLAKEALSLWIALVTS
jgi:hypothetical protein